MVRHRDHFCLKELRDVTDRHLSVTQEIDDSQSKRFTEGLQLIRTD